MSRSMFRGLLGRNSGGGPVVLPAAYLHYDASLLALSDGAAISQWDDLTGNGHHATQVTGASQPTYDADGMGPGKGAVRFAPPRFLNIPNVLGALGAADIYVVIKAVWDEVSLGSGAALWHLGSEPTFADYYLPTISDAAGSTTRRSITRGVSGTTPRIYHVRTGPGLWEARLDAAALFSTAVNTVGWTTTPKLGRNLAGNGLAGWLGEVRIFSSHLSDAARDALVAELRAKWQPATPPSGLYLQYDASTIALSDGASVSQWDDASGNAYHATQDTAGSRPTYGASGLSTGKAGVVFLAGRRLQLPNVLGHLGEGHVFAVLRRTSGSSGAPWRITGYTGSMEHYPFSDGAIYNATGAERRHSVGNPGAGATLQPHLFHVHTAPGSWTARFNTTQLFTTASNRTSWGGEAELGSASWPGVLSELRVYHGSLTTPERNAIEADLKAKWGLTGY